LSERKGRFRVKKKASVPTSICTGGKGGRGNWKEGRIASRAIKQRHQRRAETKIERLKDAFWSIAVDLKGMGKENQFDQVAPKNLWGGSRKISYKKVGEGMNEDSFSALGRRFLANSATARTNCCSLRRKSTR